MTHALRRWLNQFDAAQAKRNEADTYKLALSKLRTAGRQRRRQERKAKHSQSHAFLIREVS